MRLLMDCIGEAGLKLDGGGPSTASILILWVRGTVQIEIGTPNFNLDCALVLLSEFHKTV